MHLSFGPLRVRLQGSKRWLSLARHRYGSFLCEEKTGYPLTFEQTAIEVDYTAVGDGPSTRLLGESLLRPPEMTRRAGVWHLRAPGISGRLHRQHIEIRGPLATYPLDSALLALWHLAAGPDAAIVHGALLADVTGDRGWLCTGPSGVGKSTLAALLPDQARCDELVGVRLEDGVLFAYSLPFWHGRPARVRLAGVHFLRHGSEHSRRPLTASRAFVRLRSQVLWPSWYAAALSGAFRLAAELAEIPCHVLDFLPNPAVWRHLDAHPMEAVS